MPLDHSPYQTIALLSIQGGDLTAAVTVGATNASFQQQFLIARYDLLYLLEGSVSTLFTNWPRSTNEFRWFNHCR